MVRLIWIGNDMLEIILHAGDSLILLSSCTAVQKGMRTNSWDVSSSILARYTLLYIPDYNNVLHFSHGAFLCRR